MRQAFSLVEIIFAIAIIAILASVAVPKFMSSGDDAKVAALKQDIITVVTSLQSYYLINGKIDKISDAVTINSANWDIASDTKKIIYKEDEDDCVTVAVTDTQIDVNIKGAGNICRKLLDSGMKSSTYKLN